MNFLILGSSGFIGKNFCFYLKSLGHNILEFDIENNQNEDLRIPQNQKLIDHVKICDFIFFLAFDVGGAKYLSSKEKNFGFILNNLKILSNTFEVIEKYNKQFIFISSYQVYKPDNSYAALKLLGEHLTHSLNGLVVRLYNIYGEEKVSLKSHVIPDLIDQAVKNSRIILSTNGNERRQFLYIEDCCKGLYGVYSNFDSILNETNVVDLTSFKWNSITSIAKLISKKVKCTIEFSDKNSSFLFLPKPNLKILKYWKAETSIDVGINKILNKYNLK